MLIAKLVRYYPFGGDEPMYAAVDPFDDEQLTQWHETIKQVDEELVASTPYGLNLAAYAGESDVPHRHGEEVGDGTLDDHPCECGTAIPCH